MNILSAILEFIVKDVFGRAPIFIALIVIVGLALQKKRIGEIVIGGVKAAIGTIIITTGTSIIAGSITHLSDAFNAIHPTQAVGGQELGADYFSANFGMEIGIVMILSFLINILVARFTKFKTIFLTGHMLYWFPFVFIAAGYDAGLQGVPLIVLATIFTALYMVVSPNLLQPFVRAVTGGDDIAIGHPTTSLSILSGLIARVVGDKDKSTEDIEVPKSLSFLKEVGISSSIIIAITYLVFGLIMVFTGADYMTVYGLTTPAGMVTFSLIQGLTFGGGITVMMLGVRMMVSELVPAFKGISNRFVPDAIPALDAPMLFPYAPNAMVIGFIVSMITSVITIIITGYMGIFPTVILPLTVTCCFEIGAAGVIANAQGGLRGTIIGTAVAGVVMVLLVGIGSSFFLNTINSWLLVYGGQDFSLWGMVEGLIARLLAGMGV